MQGEPGSMQEAPHYHDVLCEVSAWLAERARALEAAGVARERIAIDPGIGFGKTVEHNLELLRRLPELAALGYPVVLGASRKRFIGAITGGEPPDRLEGSLAAALWAASHGASVLRVHDVAATVKALAVTRAIESGEVPAAAGS
jgi:dihydropteroate synthase